MDFGGVRWTSVGLRWSSVDFGWSSVEFGGLRWTSVGLRWISVEFGGLRWSSVDFGWTSVELNSTDGGVKLHRTPTEVHRTPPKSNRSPTAGMPLFGAVWRGVTLFGELVIVPDGSILDFVGFRSICRQREVAPESY